MYQDKRDGEIELPFDPATTADDARLIFVGHIASPWRTRSECPRNLRIARERGAPARIVVDEPFWPCLEGLEDYSHIVVLYWMHEARRDLIAQAPRHSLEPAGTFALRSPVRPNPIALATVRVLKLEPQAGIIEIDAIDCLDGTPLLDIKPFIESIDGAH